jgi:hypothetical protein
LSDEWPESGAETRVVEGEPEEHEEEEEELMMVSVLQEMT